MLGLAGEDLIRKVLAHRRRLRPRGRASSRGGRRRASWVEGIAAIDRKLRPLLESEGVSRSRRSAGSSSTPTSTRPSPTCPGTGRPGGEIVEEVRRGYRMRDRVIRPALVAVAADAGAAAAPDQPIH